MAPSEADLRPTDRVPPHRAGALERVPATALLDNVRSVWNVGSMFRSADAAGLAGLYLVGMTATPPRPDMEKTALGATKTVPWDYWTAADDALAAARARGATLVAVEQAPDSTPLHEWRCPFPCCFVMGHEVGGVAPEVLELCDQCVEIPMSGTKRSLNVAVTFGIVAIEIRRQWLERMREDAE